VSGVARQSGFILLPVVLLITLVSVVAFLLNHESALGTGTIGSHEEAKQADYVARAGLQHAIWGAQNSACAGDLTLASIPFGVDSYQATVTSAASTTTYTVNVDQDAWLKESSPAENHGTDGELSVKAAAGDDMRTLYHFDLSAVPAGAQIGSATAWFYVTSNDDQGAVNIHEVTAAWTEAAATWTTTADQFNSAVIVSIPTQVSGGVWVQVNLTTLVQSWVNGNPNNGIMLVATSDAVESKYTSREWSPGSEQPWLQVVATSGPSSPVTVSATGTLANGVTRTLSRVDIPAYQTPFSLDWQPGAELEDAFVWDGVHTFKNFGISPILNIKNDRNVLIRFALEALPPGARVTDARLGLYLEGGSGVVDGVLDLHRISRSWVEGIYDDADPAAGAGVTYQEYDGGNPWTTPGGDYDATVIDSVTLPSMVPGWYAWNVTGQIQDWLDGAPNYGFLLREGGGDAGDIDFTSSDNTGNPENRPRLTLTFACECGIACQIPQGYGNILMVVSNEWAMTDGEKAKKSLFEVWGYTVDLISQWDVDWNFDAKAANNDVVYVSEAVTSSTFGMAPKLAATSLGVINEEGGINDELGIAAGSARPVGNSITITDTSHYITQPFAAGNLQIYSAAMEGLMVSGSEAAGLQTLADWGGAGSLVVLDTGAALEGGGSAPGRRVMLPLGQDQDFNMDYLNNNGRLIVQRALQWGTGNTGPLVNDPIFLSTDSAATLGGLAFDDIDLAEYDPPADSASLFFEGAPTTLLIDIDALHVLANGHILLSTKDAATLGGLSFADGDLVEYDPATDTAVLYFDEAAFSADEDIISVYIMANGHILLSTDSNATLGGLSFTDKDLVEYNPGSDTATLYFDGSTTTLSSDIDAVHLLDNGNILLSTTNDDTLGGLSFKDGDLVDYDPVTDTAVRYFDEARFTSDEDVISAHIGIGSGSGGGGSPGPPAGNKLLMVVVNPSSLTAQEDTKKTLIESWGYTVSLIDESDSQAGFDAELATNDVVFVTEDVTASTIGTKLVNTSIGVVTEEANLSDEFGLADGIHWGSGTDLKITNTHYITQPFAEGDLTILSTAESLADLTGALAPDILTIGNSADGLALAAVEAGANVIAGRTAAGHRVQLPWGGNNFDVNRLTPDGLTIMRRAIEWGAGAGSGLPDLLFVSGGSVVVQPPSGDPLVVPTAQEQLRIDLIESWGYTVTLIHEADLQTDFDAALAVNGVAYISGDVDASVLGTKLTATGVGVVNEQIALHDELGFSSSSGTKEHDMISVVDNAHSITDGFSTGWLVVATTNQPLNALEGTLASGLQTLAEVWINGANYKDGLAVLDTGAQLYGGGTAAGRRAQLPWGVTGLDFNALNDNGKTIMQRAIEWAAVPGGGGGPGIEPPGTCNGTFRDEFNAVSFGNNDGTLNWADDWLEVGESDGPGSNDVRVRDDNGPYQLWLRDNQNGGEGVEREADLSGAAAVTLSFEYRRSSLDNTSDYVKLEISSNGAAGPWAELTRFQGSATDSAYQSFSQDISAYISAATRIRLITSPTMGNMDTVIFDNVQIQCSP
jgi:hypothetical protein